MLNTKPFPNRLETALVAIILLTASVASAQSPTAPDASSETTRVDPTDSEPAQAEPASGEPATTAPPAECVPTCRPGFACVGGQCVNACNPPCNRGEMCTAELQCVPDPEQGPVLEDEREPEVDPDTDLVGVKGFFGIVLGGGLSMHTWRTGDNQLDEPTNWGAFLFALRAGLFVNQNEVSLEWAPGTYRPVLGEATTPADEALDNDQGITSFLGSYAYHIHMAKGAYWPMRFGAGLVSRSHGGQLSGTDFQGRIDLLNISVKTKFLLLDFSFPSIRYVSDFDAYHRWTGLFTAGLAFIAP